jgi:hypothetical protein
MNGRWRSLLCSPTVSQIGSYKTSKVLVQCLTGCLATVLCSASLWAQDGTLHGIDVKDLNRKANPSEDFYEFANGSWRLNSPTPPSMVIWSKACTKTANSS